MSNTTPRTQRHIDVAAFAAGVAKADRYLRMAKEARSHRERWAILIVRRRVLNRAYRAAGFDRGLRGAQA